MWSFWALPCLSSLPHWQHGQWFRNAFWWKLGCHDLGNAEKCRNGMKQDSLGHGSLFSEFQNLNTTKWQTVKNRSRWKATAFSCVFKLVSLCRIKGILCFECIATQVVAADELQSGQAIVLPGSKKKRSRRMRFQYMQCQECQDMSGTSRCILIERRVAMMIFVCEAAPLHNLSEALQGGADFSEQSMDQRWHSWNMIDIGIRSGECAM